MGEVGLSPNNKMATTAKARPYKQDLPPKGGYAPITFKRIPAQQIMKDRWWLGAFIVYQTGALIYMKHALNQEKKLRVEERSVELALQPLLLAERDRGLIKFLKKQRDQEEDLFSDVPDWEVGTFYGTPVYKTVPDSLLIHHYTGNSSKLSYEFGAHLPKRLWGLEFSEHKNRTF